MEVAAPLFFILWENNVNLFSEKIIHMKTKLNLSILLVFFGISFALAQAPEYGNAIYYADYFHGKRTASGETYDKYGFTCAHKVHPFGTQLKVTRMDNFKSVVVRVNDRGPYNPGCVIDISWAAADQIGLLLDGKVEVKVEVTGFSGGGSAQAKSPNAAQITPASVPEEYSYNAAPVSNAQPISQLLPPKTITFNNAFPETTDYQAAKSPAAKAAPADVPVSYNAFSEPIGAPASSKVTMMAKGQLGYSIQVGSYALLANAERQAKMIADKGVQQVYVKESRKADGTALYKILVRVFDDRNEASAYLPQLKSKFGVAGYVVNLANM